MQENKTFRMKWLAVALSIALLGTGMGMGLGYAVNGGVSAEAEGISSLAAQASVASDLESPFKSVYEQVSRSVVGIQLNLERTISSGRIQTQSAFVGSGVVIDDGYVVTNYHVVTAGGSEVATDISVVYEDEVYQAKYLAGDESSDVAVLQVEDLPAPAVPLGDSDALSVGDWALVIGNPLGENFTNTLTVGIISGLDRDMTSQNRRGEQTGTTMIQTDAAINSGNSGGGLFNIRGELIGITSMKLSNNGYWGSASIEGFGFAIPINTVIKVADDLIDYGKVVYPRVGIDIRTMDSPSEEPTKDHLPQSIWVTGVEEGSPAAKAGIEVNDLIVEADGQRVTTAAELQSVIRSHQAGDTIEIKVYRVPKLLSITEDQEIPEGEYLTFDVNLEILD